MKIKKYLEKLLNKTITTSEAGAALFFIDRIRGAIETKRPLKIKGFEYHLRKIDKQGNERVSLFTPIQFSHFELVPLNGGQYMKDEDLFVLAYKCTKAPTKTVNK